MLLKIKNIFKFFEIPTTSVKWSVITSSQYYKHELIFFCKLFLFLFLFILWFSSIFDISSFALYHTHKVHSIYIYLPPSVNDSRLAPPTLFTLCREALRLGMVKFQSQEHQKLFMLMVQLLYYRLQYFPINQIHCQKWGTVEAS